MNSLKTLAISILAVFAPIQATMVTVLVLVIADLITGLLAAKKSKDPITSAGLRRTIIKIFLYQGAIILAFLTQKYLTGETIPVSNIVAGFIGLTELTSVVENMNIISGKSLFKALLSKLDSVNKNK